jgi:predicted transcriptional regulator
MPTKFNSESKPPSLDYIIKRTSDEKALNLFKSIALSEVDGSASLMKAELTAKQYYGRISGLMDAGLIKRYKGKYSLTLLGTLVHLSLMTIRDALEYHPTLRAK